MSQPRSYFILKLNVNLRISNLIAQKLKFMLNVKIIVVPRKLLTIERDTIEYKFTKVEVRFSRNETSFWNNTRNSNRRESTLDSN